MSDLTGTSFNWTEVVGWQLGLIDVYQVEEAFMAIEFWKYHILSNLHSWPEYCLVSTMVGDHVGILGTVVSYFEL